MSKFIDENNEDFLNFIDDNRTLLEKEFLDIYTTEFYEYCISEYNKFLREVNKK